MAVFICMLILGLVASLFDAARSRRALRKKAPSPPPPVSPQTQKMMGVIAPGDEKVSVPVRNWNAMKLAIWRSKTALAIAEREAAVIIEHCRHEEGCPGKVIETEPCWAKCPDREQRMSALVILNATRPLVTIDARKPASATYFAPSREHFSEVLAELASTQAELEAVRDERRTVQTSGVEPAPVALKEAQ